MAKELSFEAEISRLEAIVAALEDGSEPLDSSMSLFEQGVKLAANCEKKLQKAEQKIRQLTDLEKEGEEA